MGWMMRAFGHMHFVKAPLRERIIARFHDPETALPESFQVTFEGFRYKGDFASCLDWQVYYFGAYAPEELRLIRDVLAEAPTSTMLDVGGNCGHHAMYASRHCSQVVTFEPLPRMYEQIVEKISTNKIPNIRLCKFGLGASNEFLNFYPPADNHTGLGSFQLPTGAEPIQLEVRKGDEAVLSENLSNISFIKIDVEGFECEALRGLAETTAQMRPIMFIEWSPSSQSGLNGQAFSQLFPENYSCYAFEDGSYIPRWRAFRKPGYALHQCDLNQPPIANLLLIPNEKRDLAVTQASALGKRLESSG